MPDVLFITKEAANDLSALGMKVKDCPEFLLDKSEGVLVPDDVVSDFVKKSGVRLEKATTDYAEIFQLLGYMKPTLKKEDPTDYIDGKGAATVVDEDQKSDIKVEKYDMGLSEYQKKKAGELLDNAVQALTDLKNMLN